MPSERIVWFTWLAESVQKDRLSRRQGMVTRVQLRRRGGGGGDAPRRRGSRAGSSKGEAAVRTAADLHVFVWWLGGVGDPAQSILETGVQIDEQGLGVLI